MMKNLENRQQKLFIDKIELPHSHIEAVAEDFCTFGIKMEVVLE